MEAICSISTPQGIGAVAIVRMSGDKVFNIADRFFSFDFINLKARMAKYAEFADDENVIDQVVVTKYEGPHSYTGEDMVEISCHGSVYIQQKILQLLIENGCRMAHPGEYSMRAFMNGKMDLPQAEAVGDLIDSHTEASHRLAVNQLKGQFSNKIKELRAQFMVFASLLELELDFSEEDVQFANRDRLQLLLEDLKNEVDTLIASFKMGNAVKNGVPVAIAGKPNVGKSTLLNTLLNDERAIVSDIPGTTRDTIEDTLNLNGTLFRFIDTAGIRNSDDAIENCGIERSYKAIKQADIVLYLIDKQNFNIGQIEDEIHQLQENVSLKDKHLLILMNKIDKITDNQHLDDIKTSYDYLMISAKNGQNIDLLKERLSSFVSQCNMADQVLLTNVRHYDVFLRIRDAIERIEQGFANQIPTDLVAIDVRDALHCLGLVTGEIATDDILNLVFSKFCIGK